MTTKTKKILQIFTTRSSILSIFILLIIPFALSQTPKPKTVTGTCTFETIQGKGYTCILTNVTIVNSTDYLEITGTHLADHNNADVLSVVFKSNKIAYFNGEILRKFTNLRSIEMVGQGVKEISYFAFDVCTNLAELTVGDEEVREYPSGMLKMCKNLRNFNVFGSEMTFIPEDLFGDIKDLEEFRLSSTKLTSLPANLLKNMENLRTLVVTKNPFKVLDPNLLKNVVNLQEVDLSKNELNDSENIINLLNGHTDIIKMDLCNNDYRNFDFNFFSQFKNLEELIVGSKVGPELNNISWHLLPASLIDLTVYESGENLPENLCSQLVNLKSLTVTGYGIKDIHKDTFKSLGHLERLSIVDTRVKTLHQELFKPLTSLSDLKLEYMFLKELPAGIFTPLVNIGSKSEFHGISLFVNSLKRLDANVFGIHPQMKSLNFSTNLLEEIERGIFKKFHPFMTRIGLQGNICVDRVFENVENLDDNEALKLCFDNWDENAPDGCKGNFRGVEVFLIILGGFFVVLLNYQRN